MQNEVLPPEDSSYHSLTHSLTAQCLKKESENTGFNHKVRKWEEIQVFIKYTYFFLNVDECWWMIVQETVFGLEFSIQPSEVPWITAQCLKKESENTGFNHKVRK